MARVGRRPRLRLRQIIWYAMRENAKNKPTKKKY